MIRKFINGVLSKQAEKEEVARLSLIQTAYDFLRLVAEEKVSIGTQDEAIFLRGNVETVSRLYGLKEATEVISAVLSKEGFSNFKVYTADCIHLRTPGRWQWTVRVSKSEF